MYHYQFPVILKRSERAQERLRNELFLASKPLQLEYAVTEEHLSFAEKDRLKTQVVPDGKEGSEFIWGRSGNLVWRSAWFCAQADLNDVLAQWQSGKSGQNELSGQSETKNTQIALHLNFSGEGLVFDQNGKIIQAISGGSILHSSFQRSLVLRAEELLQAGKIKIWIEAAANTLFGLEREDNPSPQTPRYYGEHIGKVYSAQVVLLDTELWHYLRELESATQLAQNLLHSKAAGTWGSSDSQAGKNAAPRAKRLIWAIDQSLSLSAVGKLSEAREILRKTLVNGNAPSDLSTIAVGHAHIDTGWLWPVQETVRKCARTFANQLRLMEHYPSYIFGASQAQHYAFVKKHYPEIYQKVKQRVAEGRWEIQGAMWLEADANIPSGESLVRQILHGKNFFRDEFGVDVQNLWLPDVFGYCANLPQILERAGVPYFLTQKLSWSQYNDFPHHTFHWRGVDGSSVLTHFPPEATYNSTLTLGGVHGLGLSAAQNHFKESHVLDKFMTLYGVGDGGGGPDEDMIERGLCLAEGVEQAPKVEFGRADEFFARLASKAELLPCWEGELYLELHRGTLTSQARSKWGNRRLEQALRLVEYVYCLSPDITYPQEQIDRLWKLLLLNQFHDIIPGSSIHEVYQRTEREHREALEECQELIEHWRAQVVGQAADQAAENFSLQTIINPYSLPISMRIALPEAWQGLKADDQVEILAAGDGEALIRLAPQAIACLEPGPAKALDSSESVIGQDDGAYILENHLIRYRFSEQGQLQEAWDKELGRSILADAGAGNCLRLYRDWPNDWDAWDIDINYQAELLQELQAKKVESPISTGLCRQLRFFYDCGQASSLKQTVSLEAHSKQLLFCHRVDWQERHSMLRVGFELAVRSQQASYDIQYAYLQRPTHRNTSWEMAQFEVVGQRYADLSDLDYGVCLLNDSKYGYQVVGNRMDLNLLRSPTLPDPDADLGQQQFSYALLPHGGSLVEAMPLIQASAARLNAAPLQVAGRLNISLPLRLESDYVNLEVLKQAEKSQDLIIRLVERGGRHSKAILEWDSGVLQECDLMEWHNIGEVLSSGVELDFQAFEIRTFRLMG